MTNENKSILIVGADGLIGNALVHELCRRSISVTGTSRHGGRDGTRILLDLANSAETWRWPSTTVAAVLCAGITRQESCRIDPVESARINVCNTVALARRLVADGIFVVFLSSNQVFDGTTPYRLAWEPTSPATEYGRQKAATEQQLLALGAKVAVVRFAKVLGPRPPLFKEWEVRMCRGETIHPFADMVMAPVGLDFAVEVLVRVTSLRQSGIFQVSAPEDVTYAQVGHHLAHLLQASPDLVKPVRAAEAGVPLEANPRYTTLDPGRLTRDLGLQPPAVWTVLDQILATLTGVVT